jgi:hypothetical protein
MDSPKKFHNLFTLGSVIQKKEIEIEKKKKKAQIKKSQVNELLNWIPSNPKK